MFVNICVYNLSKSDNIKVHHLVVILSNCRHMVDVYGQSYKVYKHCWGIFMVAMVTSRGRATNQRWMYYKFFKKEVKSYNYHKIMQRNHRFQNRGFKCIKTHTYFNSN